MYGLKTDVLGQVMGEESFQKLTDFLGEKVDTKQIFGVRPIAVPPESEQGQGTADTVKNEQPAVEDTEKQAQKPDPVTTTLKPVIASPIKPFDETSKAIGAIIESWKLSYGYHISKSAEQEYTCRFSKPSPQKPIPEFTVDIVVTAASDDTKAMRYKIEQETLQRSFVEDNGNKVEFDEILLDRVVENKRKVREQVKSYIPG